MLTQGLTDMMFSARAITTGTGGVKKLHSCLGPTRGFTMFLYTSAIPKVFSWNISSQNRCPVGGGGH